MIPKRQPDEEPKKFLRMPIKDEVLYRKAISKAPANASKSGDQKYPGHAGLWGEWIASQRMWTEGMFFISAIRGYEQTKRMSLAKAWLVRCLRMEQL